MDEARWFALTTEGGRWAVPREAVWLITGPLPVNPLPGARTWCAGWVLLRDQLVPVLGGELFGGEGQPPVLVALRRGSALVALPGRSVDLVGGDLGAAGEAGAPLPVAGALEGGAAPGTLVLDVERLYSGLGLPIESLSEDRG